MGDIFDALEGNLAQSHPAVQPGASKELLGTLEKPGKLDQPDGPELTKTPEQSELLKKLGKLDAADPDGVPESTEKAQETEGVKKLEPQEKQESVEILEKLDNEERTETEAAST